MMQAASDIFLGWTSDEPLGIDFYVRILKNRRLGAVSELAEQQALSEYARLCGRTLARSHARSGDPAVIAGYMGRNGAFDDALASFAMAYADQTVKDHAALVKAKRGGKAEAPSKAPPSRRGSPPEGGALPNMDLGPTFPIGPARRGSTAAFPSEVAERRTRLGPHSAAMLASLATVLDCGAVPLGGRDAQLGAADPIRIADIPHGRPAKSPCCLARDAA